MRIFVTGANGFVGSHLVSHLIASGHTVTAAVRTQGMAPAGSTESVITDIGPDSDWNGRLGGHDVVIHLAARVHVMSETSENPIDDFRRVNSGGTRSLATAAAEQGVRRFVYLSSIKVNGESTGSDPFRASDPARPLDPYGVSKHEAEVALAEIASASELEIVVVRTPLVYGPGVAGNFVKTLWLSASGIPTPLKSVRNARTMCSVWNLADILERSAREDAARGAVVLAGDAYSPSTPELLARIACAMGKRPKTFRFPPRLLTLGGRLTGKSAVISRLTGSLEVESGSCSTSWTWVAPHSFEQSIDRTVEWYVKSREDQP